MRRTLGSHQVGKEALTFQDIRMMIAKMPSTLVGKRDRLLVLILLVSADNPAPRKGSIDRGKLFVTTGICHFDSTICFPRKNRVVPPSINTDPFLRMLSASGNPTVQNLDSVLKAMGLKLTVMPDAA